LQCQEINSIACLLSMEDAVFVIHAPLGCTGCISFGNEQYKIGQHHAGRKILKNARYLATNLDEHDIVFGGEEKLKEAVLEAETRYHPGVIFIFASCASGIIADDIDAAAEKLQQEVKAIVVPIHCEGFKSRLMSTGYDAAFNAIAHYILKGYRPEPEDGLINLFAPVSIGIDDQEEIIRLLGVMGLHVNFVPFYSNLEKIKKIPAAVASASICQVFADNFMKWLSEEYQIPHVITGMPLGVRNTDEWLLGIAKLVGKEKEISEYIEREHARVTPQVAEVRSRLEGKRVFICAGTARSFAAAALIEDYGMKLVGMETPSYEEVVSGRVDKLIELYGDNFILDIANMQPFEQSNLVNRLQPDLFIGMAAWAAKQGVPTMHVNEAKRPTMGYDGILYLGRKMVDAIDNPGFNVKLARHKRLPYRDSWYGEDPFKYHKELGGA